MDLMVALDDGMTLFELLGIHDLVELLDVFATYDCWVCKLCGRVRVEG